MCPMGEGQLPKSKSEELLPKDMEIDIWHMRITEGSTAIFSILLVESLLREAYGIWNQVH